MKSGSNGHFSVASRDHSVHSSLALLPTPFLSVPAAAVVYPSRFDGGQTWPVCNLGRRVIESGLPEVDREGITEPNIERIVDIPS